MSSWQRTGRPSDQLVAHMMMTMKDNIEILSHEDDDIALEGAATHCRLPHDKLTSQELACFPDIARMSRATHAVFLYLRNKTLQIWLLNPRDELTLAGLLNEVPSPYNSDTNLVRRIHGFLERYGYINFGFVRPDAAVPKSPAKHKRKVVILGAGVAGLAAARQLKGFGCDVVVLEARNRVGGRVATYRKGNCIADLGAMIVTGLAGNPVTVLARQIPMTLQKIKTRCPIYDASGKLIDKEKDDVIEKEFNRLLDACAYLAHTKGITDVDGEKLSLGSAFDIIFKQQEKRVREKKLEFWQTYCELQDKQREIQEEMISLKETIAKLHAEYSRSMNENENTENVPLMREFQSRCRRRDLQAAIRTFDKLEQKRKELELTIAEMRKHPPSDVYMNLLDRRILDWHIANLEYANATWLNNLSLKHWDQDDEFEFAGCHLSVKEGYGIVPQTLAQDLDIRLKHVVTLVKYNATGVEITCAKLADDNEVDDADVSTIKADVCLCTLPLGVLKYALTDTGDAPKFEPALPDWKSQAIRRLGFGNLNKVVLCFDRVFWDQTGNLFGHTNESNSSRGEMFLFWSIYDAPVLIALVAGQSADVLEKIADDIIVKRCMTVLTSIFGNTVPPEPTDALVTRWRTDPFARGSYSYVATDATGDDYDILAAPVVPTGQDLPRLFFAGEHTLRNYPATVHGALLSGLREAGRIGDQYFGCPYSPIALEED